MSPHSTVDSNGVSDEVPRKLQATSETGDGFTQTDFLIVGCGPAGASLACFLSSYGDYKIQKLLVFGTYWNSRMVLRVEGHHD
jgi:hypothetical protein